MTPRTADLLHPPGPSARIRGRAAQAAAKLKSELGNSSLISVELRQADTFEALRVTGPDASLFVSIHEADADNVYYLAPAEHAETCEVIGTPQEITVVAGILRRRVGLTSSA